MFRDMIVALAAQLERMLYVLMEVIEQLDDAGL